MHNNDAGHSRHDKAPPKSMETEMKDREIMLSDSDVENEFDGDMLYCNRNIAYLCHKKIPRHVTKLCTIVI